MNPKNPIQTLWKILSELHCQPNGILSNPDISQTHSFETQYYIGYPGLTKLESDTQAFSLIFTFNILHILKIFILSHDVF